MSMVLVGWCWGLNPAGWSDVGSTVLDDGPESAAQAPGPRHPDLGVSTAVMLTAATVAESVINSLPDLLLRRIAADAQDIQRASLFSGRISLAKLFGQQCAGRADFLRLVKVGPRRIVAVGQLASEGKLSIELHWIGLVERV